MTSFHDDDLYFHDMMSLLLLLFPSLASPAEPAAPRSYPSSKTARSSPKPSARRLSPPCSGMALECAGRPQPRPRKRLMS